MALVTLASAKGSPGVTTAATLAAALWPRESLIVEADPSGADVALRMPGIEGTPLDSQLGLASLVAAGRKSLYPELVNQHAQYIVGGQRVIAGLASPEQAKGIALWPELGSLFAQLPGVDVIADLGRLGVESPQEALLDASAATLLLVDTVPSNVIHLRERLGRLRSRYGRVAGPKLHVAVVAPPKRSRAVRECAEALERAELEVAAVHHLAEDSKGAAFFLGQVAGSPSRTALVRSAQPIVADLAGQLEPFFVSAPTPQSAEEEAAAESGEQTTNSDWEAPR